MLHIQTDSLWETDTFSKEVTLKIVKSPYWKSAYPQSQKMLTLKTISIHLNLPNLFTRPVLDQYLLLHLSFSSDYEVHAIVNVSCNTWNNATIVFYYIVTVVFYCCILLLYCIVLFCIELYCIVFFAGLYCDVLYCIVFLGALYRHQIYYIAFHLYVKLKNDNNYLKLPPK